MHSRHFQNKKQTAYSKLHSLIAVPQVPAVNVEKCPICIETMMDKAQLDGCKHEFCYSCIMRWSKIVPACPLCKSTSKTITSGKNVFVIPPKVATESEDDSGEDEEDDSEDNGDDEDDLQSDVPQQEVQLLERNFGYDSDDGFVVDDETLEYDSGNENEGVDAILDHADALLLRQRKRKRKQRRQVSDSDDRNREGRQSLLPSPSAQEEISIDDDDDLSNTNDVDHKNNNTTNQITTSIQFLQQFAFRSDDNSNSS